MRIGVLQIVSIFLTVALCSSNTVNKTLVAEGDHAVNDKSNVDSIQFKSVKKEDRLETKLPVLPPIILLDFGNHTEDSNVTIVEKLKRTVNDNLGHGFVQKSFHSRKYNYCASCAKTGVAVIVDDSINPFYPTTVIERMKSNGLKEQFGIQKNLFAESIPNTNEHKQSSKSQHAFGLRTPKPPISDTYGLYAAPNSGFSNDNVPTTTFPSLLASNAQTIRNGAPSLSNFVQSNNRFNYAATVSLPNNENASTFPQGQKEYLRSNSNGISSIPQSSESPTVSALRYNSYTSRGTSQLPNKNRYVVENGVRYENKVFWRYPDGQVSDVPPPTYVETHREYPQSLPQQQTVPQASRAIYESPVTESSISSQGPVQFPTVSEQSPQQPNSFVSSESLLSSLPQQQIYRLGYQNLVSQKHHVNVAQQQKQGSNAGVTSTTSPSSRSAQPKFNSNLDKYNYLSRTQQTTSRYMVNSPNPEYVNLIEPKVNRTNTSNDSTASPDWQFPKAPPKPIPKVREYLDRVISQKDDSQIQSFNTNDPSGYTDLHDLNLLNYKPSISEYIRNPSSILNVRPTFIQTGNSLIPVIILKADREYPVQKKISQNLNLEALLQQYLIQNIKSIEEPTQLISYNLGSKSPSRSPEPASGTSSILDLTRVPQGVMQNMDYGNYASNLYTGRSSYETSNLDNPTDFISYRYTGGLTNK